MGRIAVKPLKYQAVCMDCGATLIMDANTADVWLQCALFGEEVYC